MIEEIVSILIDGNVNINNKFKNGYRWIDLLTSILHFCKMQSYI